MWIEQEPIGPVPDRVQLPPVENVTVPVGVSALVWSRSDTVVVQLVDVWTTIVEGTQLVKVVVGLCSMTLFTVKVSENVVVKLELVALICMS